MRLWVVACFAWGCSVGDRYVVAPSTMRAIVSVPLEARARTAAPARRIRDNTAADVRVDAFSFREQKTLPDGQVAIPTRLFSKKIQLAQALVWTGTPLSLAGLGMVIFGRNAVRWTGIAVAVVAEPVMIAGTVLWVKGANAHPQELPRGLADVTYLPDPTLPPSSR